MRNHALWTVTDPDCGHSETFALDVDLIPKGTFPGARLYMAAAEQYCLHRELTGAYRTDPYPRSLPLRVTSPDGVSKTVRVTAEVTAAFWSSVAGSDWDPSWGA